MKYRFTYRRYIRPEALEFAAYPRGVLLDTVRGILLRIPGYETICVRVVELHGEQYLEFVAEGFREIEEKAA